MSKNSKNLGFRGWFYFREGWTGYFAFSLSAMNTLVVTYFLAIERYPVLETIFPNFSQYVLIISAVGIPSLIAIGYSHWKKTAARKAEVDISYEINPYVMRIIVNSELLLKINLKFERIIQLYSTGTMSKEHEQELKELQQELQDFISSRHFSHDTRDDWKYFSQHEKV